LNHCDETNMPSEPTFDRDRYWRLTLKRTVILLTIWAIVGLLMGIVLVEPLNRFRLGGVPLGFWMAHQGAIYAFVVLIFVNAWLADRQDHEFDVHETESTTQHVLTGEH
jgi:putative solute:sodium symporter small subunit